MLTPNIPPSRKFIAELRSSGFSLVEVVLAVGVISFAFVAILGLLPAGLHQFRQAMDTSVASQISQRIIQDAQQTDFDILTEVNTVAKRDPASTTPFTSMVYPAGGSPRAVRYFDEQGNEISPQGTLPSSQEQAAIVYTVNTRIQPWPTLPGVTQADTTATAAAYGRSMVTLTVQVVYNPACKAFNLQQSSSDPNYLLIDTTNAQMKNMSIRNFCAVVGRND